MRATLACLLLMTLAAGVVAAETSEDRPVKRRAPFKVLWSNDTTHILSCRLAPYSGDRRVFNAEKMRDSVDEVTGVGVDVQMLQPGFSWIPWYDSTFYTRDDHAAWFRQRFPDKTPDPFTQYWLIGGDIVGDFVDRSKQKRQPRFVSMRLNHSPFPGQEWRTSSRWYDEHPEYCIGPAPKWVCHPDWALAAVREHRFTQLREICERYDVDGVELDFMRFPLYFDVEKTPEDERRTVMTQFVARVRGLLDRTSPPGRRRWLCVRVPGELAPHKRLGIDLRAMADAGADMLNLSCYYFTQQQNDLARICELAPDAAVYLEVTYCSSRNTSEGGRKDARRLSNEHQLYTAAHLAYRRGARGVSFFNFVYYRHYGHQPPWHVIRHMRDPDWLARQPQWYFVDAHDFKYWQSDYRGPLPKAFEPGRTHAFDLDAAPTGTATEGVFRLMTTEDTVGCTWQVSLNGTALQPRAFVRKPLDHPYTSALGRPAQYACFTVLPSLVKDGRNTIAVTLEAGRPMTLRYFDLVLK